MAPIFRKQSWRHTMNQQREKIMLEVGKAYGNENGLHWITLRRQGDLFWCVTTGPASITQLFTIHGENAAPGNGNRSLPLIYEVKPAKLEVGKEYINDAGIVWLCLAHLDTWLHADLFVCSSYATVGSFCADGSSAGKEFRPLIAEYPKHTRSVPPRQEL